MPHNISYHRRIRVQELDTTGGFETMSESPVTKNFIKIEEHLWGQEYWIVNNLKYCGKFLYLNKGFVSSLHYHAIKDEVFYIVSGDCVIELEGVVYQLETGNSIRIKPGKVHKFWTTNDKGCKVLEISTTHTEEDVVRLERSKKTLRRLL